MATHRAFENALYHANAEGYDAFVRHCQYGKILDKLFELFGADRPRVLELGAGAGIFTAPLSAQCASIVAIEQSGKQLDILGARLSQHGADNVTAIEGDARQARPELGRFDIVFMGFSLDNICEVDVYGASSCHHIEAVLALYERQLTPKGRFVIVDSMPEDTIGQARRATYLACREHQFALFDARKDPHRHFIDYRAQFEDQASAHDIVAGITGDRLASDILGTGAHLDLKAYVQAFS